MRACLASCGPACRMRLPAGGCALEYSDEPHTLEEVGELLQLCGERVRVIEVKALRKLRLRLAAEGIDADALLGGDLDTPGVWNGGEP